MTVTESSDAISTHHYDKPELTARKAHIPLGKTPYGVLKIQVMNEDSANNLHSHPILDGYWFVLKGGMRFYTTDDEVVAELHENEGFVVPRGYKYWFEAIPGEDDLELLEFHASTVALGEVKRDDSRINHAPRTAANPR